MLIGEVARRSGVSARMLRHYDSLGLVRPTGRTVGGYREYSHGDIRRIFHVEGLRSLGLTLSQIGRALDDPAFTPHSLAVDLIRQSEERLRREQELLERLRTVHAAEPAGWQDVLRIVELLHALGSHSAATRQQAVLATPEDMPVPPDRLVEAVLRESDPNVAGALRWALARAGGDVVERVAAGMASTDTAVRERAVRALAELPGDEATRTLVHALDDTDATIRRRAALTLGARGMTQAIPTLIRTVVDGPNDVEAAEFLGRFASEATWADDIMAALVDELAAHADDSAVRLRLTQALAEMPGTIALHTLRQLTRDDDRAVAILASALVRALERPDDAPAPA